MMKLEAVQQQLDHVISIIRQLHDQFGLLTVAMNGMVFPFSPVFTQACRIRLFSNEHSLLCLPGIGASTVLLFGQSAFVRRPTARRASCCALLREWKQNGGDGVDVPKTFAVECVTRFRLNGYVCKPVRKMSFAPNISVGLIRASPMVTFVGIQHLI